MARRSVVWLVFLLAFALAGAGCTMPFGSPGPNGEDDTGTGGPTVVAESDAIKMYEPSPGQTVSGSFILKGIARVYESTVSFELLVDGNKVVDGFTTASDFEWGTFEVSVTIPAGVGGDGVLRIYSESAEDGSPMHLVEIPLQVAAVAGSEGSQNSGDNDSQTGVPAQIKVHAPADNQIVRGTLHLTGIARVYEATVHYELRQGSQVLLSGFTTATDWEWGVFDEHIKLPGGATGAATLRVYAESAEDGSPMHLVEIPLVMAEPEAVASSQQIKVFTPAPGSTVSGSFALMGKAQVYEATVSYDLTVDGVKVLEGYTTAHDWDWGTFHTVVSIPDGVGGSGMLRVFSESAEDGSATFVVTIPLTVIGGK